MNGKKRTLEDFQRECSEIDQLQSRLLAVLVERKESSQNLVALLEALSTRISNHFIDENCGVVHEAASQCAETAETCRLLCSEHALLTTRLKALLGLARRGEATSDWWDDLYKRFRDLYVHVERHELVGRNLIDSARPGQSVPEKSRPEKSPQRNELE